MNLCIHGHFYQPPREDPISNYIPDEIGAQPFGNWNERILSECYAPNARNGSFQKYRRLHKNCACERAPVRLFSIRL